MKFHNSKFKISIPIAIIISISLLMLIQKPVNNSSYSFYFNEVEIIYNPNPPPAVFPIDRWLKNKVLVYNHGSKPITLLFNVFSIYDDNEIEVSPFPQPFTLYLGPGENQTIWYFLDVSFRTGITNEDLESEDTRHIMVKIYIENAEDESDNIEFYINHTIYIIPRDNYEPNALIEGYVFDNKTGEPISNIEVRFIGANGIPEYIVHTDENGYYSINFHAHNYSDTNELHGYILTVDSFKKSFFPKPGDTIKCNITLTHIKHVPIIDYEIIATYPTGYPIWLADLDVNETHIVFASGHHCIENVDPNRHGIYFFDTNGTLLWKYSTPYQVWGIDLSDNGECIIATFLRLEKAILFHRNGTILWDTEQLGYNRFESREAKISHNCKYVAIGTTPGNLMLLNITNGKLIWETFLNGQIRGIIFTSNDSLIYASSGDGYVYKISVENGEILGKAYVEAWTPRYSLTLSKDEKYLVTISKIGRIYLIDTSTMKTLWSFDTRGGGHWTAITPDNKIILAGSGGSYGIIAFNFTGEILWFYPRISGSRSFIGNGKYILMDNEIYDLNGNLIYTFNELPHNIDFIYVTKDNSKIIAIDENGTLYILKGEFKEYELKKFTFNLKSGWNLISLPVIPENNTIEYLFGDNVFKNAYTWNPITRKYESTNKLKPGKGYWILAYKDFNATIIGEPLIECEIKLEKGWNLIGSIIDPNNVIEYPENLIYPNIYIWNSISKCYEVKSNICPGCGGWMLAYEKCNIMIHSKS